MFYIGIVLAALGLFMVYGTHTAIKLFKGGTTLAFKSIGFMMVVVGCLMIIHTNFPQYLEFLRML